MRSYWPGLFINTLLGFLIFTYASYGESGEWPVYLESLEELFVAILLTNLAGGLIWIVNRKLDNILSWKKFDGKKVFVKHANQSNSSRFNDLGNDDSLDLDWRGMGTK